MWLKSAAAQHHSAIHSLPRKWDEGRTRNKIEFTSCDKNFLLRQCRKMETEMWWHYAVPYCKYQQVYICLIKKKKKIPWNVHYGLLYLSYRASERKILLWKICQPSIHLIKIRTFMFLFPSLANIQVQKINPSLWM